MPGIATIVLVDYKGQRSHSRLEVKDKKAVEGVVSFLKGHSDAKVISASYSEPVAVPEDNTDPGKSDRVAQKLVGLYKTQPTDTSLSKAVRFSIPAPRDEDIDKDQEMDSDVAEDLKDMLQTATGKKLRFYGGYLTSKRPHSLKNKMTGV